MKFMKAYPTLHRFYRSALKRHGAYSKVNRQIEKIVFVFVVLVDLLEQHLLRVFVRNVLDHYRRSLISKIQNFV